MLLDSAILTVMTESVDGYIRHQLTAETLSHRMHLAAWISDEFHRNSIVEQIINLENWVTQHYRPIPMNPRRQVTRPRYSRRY